MDPNAFVPILQDGLFLVLMLSATPMLASLIIGLTVSIFQAVTQLQEQTLSYVPKLIGVFLTIAVMGSWMLDKAVAFADKLFKMIAVVR